MPSNTGRPGPHDSHTSAHAIMASPSPQPPQEPSSPSESQAPTADITTSSAAHDSNDDRQAAAMTAPGDAGIPSRSPSPDLPLTMTASLVLTSLPRDATAALAEAGASLFPPDQKVVVRFKPVGGSAPPLPARRELSRVGAGQRFEVVVGYLNRVLRVGEGQGSVFCYVNATFAPALDEVVGNLWKVSASHGVGDSDVVLPSV